MIISNKIDVIKEISRIICKEFCPAAHCKECSPGFYSCNLANNIVVKMEEIIKVGRKK